MSDFYEGEYAYLVMTGIHCLSIYFDNGKWYVWESPIKVSMILW